MMKMSLILYVNQDLCELYIIEENRRDFAFITEDVVAEITPGDLCAVYPAHQNMCFTRKEVSLC